MPVVLLSDACGQTVLKTGFSAVAVCGISTTLCIWPSLVRRSPVEYKFMDFS